MPRGFSTLRSARWGPAPTEAVASTGREAAQTGPGRACQAQLTYEYVHSCAQLTYIRTALARTYGRPHTHTTEEKHHQATAACQCSTTSCTAPGVRPREGSAAAEWSADAEARDIAAGLSIGSRLASASTGQHFLDAPAPVWSHHAGLRLANQDPQYASKICTCIWRCGRCSLKRRLRCGPGPMRPEGTESTPQGRDLTRPCTPPSPDSRVSSWRNMS